MSGLIDFLHARSGIVCAVGAGGKKTTLHLLAARHGGRVGLTSTVFTAHFPRRLGAHIVIAEADRIVEAVIEATAAHRLVAFAQPSAKAARYAGLSDDSLERIMGADVFDVLLVKGDGARMRWIKAPEDDEPAIPAGTATVLALVSAKAIGAPLSDEIAHRLARVEAVTGARRGETLTPEHVARLLVDERGSLKAAGDATVIPVINMVDDAELERRAVEASRIALDLSDRFPHIVLTSARRPDPLVQVVGRG